MLHELPDLVIHVRKRKPEKGRRKDLRKIDSLIEGVRILMPLFFSLRVSQTARVKGLWAVAFLGLMPFAIRAQEVTLPPMIVTGSFELRQGPSVTDLFTRHLERQIEAKRALEETAERAPWFNAKIWRYLPQMQNSQSDSSQFFTPSYLTTDYRNAERALRESQKQSLFEGR